MNKPTALECTAVLEVYYSRAYPPVGREVKLTKLAVDRLLDIFEGDEATGDTAIDRRPLLALALPTRALSFLGSAGIRTVGQLCALTASDIGQMRGLGRVTLRHICEALALDGESLKEPGRIV